MGPMGFSVFDFSKLLVAILFIIDENTLCMRYLFLRLFSFTLNFYFTANFITLEIMMIILSTVWN